MTRIETVKGAIGAEQLGRVLVHEHVFTGDIEHLLNYGDDFNEDDQVRKAAAKFNELKAAGIDSIIDLTVLGLGRYIPRIQKVAALTDINIIVSTGCYTMNELPMPFQGVGPGLMFDYPDPMPGLFVKDIVSGIAATGVKAAELKCAIDAPGLTTGVERVLRAVGQVNVRTGTPISVHTSPRHETGLIAQRVLAEEGVDLRDVIIGHSGDSTDIDYLRRLADAGSILGMDRFGLDMMLPFDDRIATIIALVAHGYLDHITLSHDCYCWTNCHPGEGSAFEGHNYLSVTQKVVPALLKGGITQAQIDVILIDNPRRHFVGAAERFVARGQPA